MKHLLSVLAFTLIMLIAGSQEVKAQATPKNYKIVCIIKSYAWGGCMGILIHYAWHRMNPSMAPFKLEIYLPDIPEGFYIESMTIEEIPDMDFEYSEFE